jgi:hypothetical protein
MPGVPRGRLLAWWRRVLLQLSDSGTDYELVQEEPGVATDGVVGVLENILRSAPDLTAREVRGGRPWHAQRATLPIGG